jgi:peroxiredoxin
MKHFPLVTIVPLAIALSTSCCQSNTSVSPTAIEPAQVAALTKDFETWYRYTYDQVLLSRKFKPLDTAGQPLTKRAFLDQLASGRVLAVVRSRDQKQLIYQLADFPGGHDSAIRATSKQLAEEALSNYKREGQQLPDFHFVDLKGVTYTKANIKGKIVVLKLWYLNCIPCVEEIPQINTLMTKYQRQPDVLFVSLAMDDAKRLRTFVKVQQVKFAIVPVSKSYMLDTLQVRQYPTHFILGRDGRIVKATTRASDLAVALQQEVPAD